MNRPRFRALALATVLSIPMGAAAQTPAPAEGRFHTGALSWTPTLTLRDAGTDSNVYDEASNPRSDHSAIFGPQAEGVLRLAAADVRFAGGVDFVYYRRYTGERSVNSRGQVRVDFRGWRFRPFARTALLDARERVSSEIDVRARRSDRDVGAGVGVTVTPRGTLEIGVAFTQTTFRQGEVFRGVDLAGRLNREGVGGTLSFKYELTPLTRFVVEGAASSDRFTLSPAYDADNLRGSAGFEFEPDALLKGRATVGFQRLEPRGALAFGHEGLTAAVDLGYVLLQRTRFDVRVARDTAYSFEAQPYYLRTMVGTEVLHNVFGPLDLVGFGSWETLDYPGLADRLLEAHTLTVSRYGGAVAIRPGARVRLTINYELTERDSTLLLERTYERRRLYTNLTYGF